MAIRTPIVMINGKLQELPVGDTIAGAPAGPAGSTGSGIPDSTAEAGETLLAGQIVYLDGNLLKRAQANTPTTSEVVGICTVGAALGGTATYVTEGLITLADWTNAVGSTSLSVGTRYFLDTANPGELTATAPTVDGQVVVAVGRATTDQTLDLIITQPILL